MVHGNQGGPYDSSAQTLIFLTYMQIKDIAPKKYVYKGLRKM